MSKPPVDIDNAYDEEFEKDFGQRHLVVNRADAGDTNVVISWNARDGSRDAVGIHPDDARAMAVALIEAAAEIEG